MTDEIVCVILKTLGPISPCDMGMFHAEQNTEIFSYSDTPFLPETSDRHWHADGSWLLDLSPTDNHQCTDNLEHPINSNSKCQKIQ
jgi:hypothetical protein